MTNFDLKATGAAGTRMRKFYEECYKTSEFIRFTKKPSIIELV